MAQFVEIDGFYINADKVIFVHGGRDATGVELRECAIYFEPFGGENRPISIPRSAKEVVTILSNKPGFR
jgi:hypothetical protein